MPDWNPRKCFAILINFLVLSVLNRTIAQVPEMTYRTIETESVRNFDFYGAYTSPVTGFTWFTTRQGFLRFDGNDFIICKEWKLRDGRECSYAEDMMGNFYLWDPADGLSYLDVMSNKIQKLRLVNDSLLNSHEEPDNITGMLIDEGFLWMSSYSRLLQMTMNEGKIIEHKVAPAILKKILPPYDEKRAKIPIYSPVADAANKNYLWMGVAAGILLFDKSTRKFIDAFSICHTGPYYTTVTKVANYGKDSLILSTMGDGFGFFDKATKRSACYPYNESFASRQISIKNHPTSFFVEGSKVYASFRDTLPAVFDITTKSYSYFTNEQVRQASYVGRGRSNATWFINNNKPVYAKKKDTIARKIDISMQSVPNAMPNSVKCIYWDNHNQQLYTGLIGGSGIIIFSDNLNAASVHDLDVSEMDKFFRGRESPVLNLVKINNDVIVTGPDQLLFATLKNEKLLRPHHLKTSYGTFSRALALNCTDGELYVVDTLFNLIVLKDLADTGHILTNFSGVFKRDGKPFIGKIIKRRNLIFYADPSLSGIYCFNLSLNRWESMGIKAAEKTTISSGVQDFEIDQLQNFWVLDGHRNLKVYTRFFEDVTSNYGIPNAVFFSLSLTDDGRIIAASEGNGLFIFDGFTKSFNQIKTGNGIASNTIYGVFTFNNKLLLSYNNFCELIDLEKNLRPHPLGDAYISRLKLLKTDSVITNPENVRIKYDENFFIISISSLEYDYPEQIIYRYRLLGLDSEWRTADFFSRNITYSNLKHGEYTFQLRVKLPGSEWSKIKKYSITIRPAFWQTVAFKILAAMSFLSLFYFIYKRRVRAIRREQNRKAAHEKELLELEAKALRSQMNPHFIFNCLNSIKSLIQDDQKDTSVVYLTTFSKLIRTLFNNADKKEITLYDEIETCKLYLQLEAMRFDSKFSYAINIAESIDLKSVHVPALIIQPFIENAIWHGIMPKATGGKVTLNISRANGHIEIVVEDDGIGRESSQQNKAITGIGHQSKGVNLTQSRLELDNLLQQRNAHLKTIDKKDQMGNPAGTKVIISIREEL